MANMKDSFLKFMINAILLILHEYTILCYIHDLLEFYIIC